MVFNARRSSRRPRRHGRVLVSTRLRRRWGYNAAALVGLLVLGSADNTSWTGHATAEPVWKTASNADHGAPAPQYRVPPALAAAPAIPAVSHDARESPPAPPEPAYGVPATVLDSYRRAAEETAVSSPGCHLSWPLLAGIGKVESGHASQGNVTPDGTMIQPIYGPSLDGTNDTAAITGESSSQWARAAGPMQFIPSSWASWGTDANGDGTKDPQNVYDASLSAGRYLCAGDRDLTTAAGLREAILSYNHSADYVDLVLRWMQAYDTGGGAVSDEPGSYDALRALAYESTGPAHASDPAASNPPPSPEQPPSPEPAPSPPDDDDHSAPAPEPGPTPDPPGPPPAPTVLEPVRRVLPPPVDDGLAPVLDPVEGVLAPPPAPKGLRLPG